MKEENKSIWVYKVLGCLVIAIAGYLLTANLQYVMDITFLDESNYLNRGVNFFKRMSKEWAPLYSGWYRFLYFFEGDTFKLFYLNFKLLSVLPYIMFYLVLVKYQFPPFISLAMAVFFMANSFNLPNEPKVSHFTIMLIFAVVYFIPLQLSLFRKFLVLIFSAIILSYARPEMYLSGLIFIGILVFLFYTKRVVFSAEDKRLIKILAFVVLVFHLVWGVPLGAKIKGESRSLIAFGEHFSYNYSQWNEIDQYLWLKQDVIVKEHFGEVNSLREAASANPTLFWKHISTNIQTFINSILNAFVESFSFYNVGKIDVLKLIFSILFFVVLVSSRFWLGRREEKSNVFKNDGYFLLMVFFVFMLPSLLSSILIYPREHYIVHQIPFYFLLFTFVFIPQRVIETVIDYRNIAVFVFTGLVLLYFMPKADDYTYFPLRKQERILNNQKALTLLTSLEVKDTVKVLNFEGDFNYIIGRNYRWVKPNEKRDTDFFEFLALHNPEIIYCTMTSFKNPWYDDDMSWHDFVSSPLEHDYVEVRLGERVAEYFLFRQDFYNRVADKIVDSPVPYSQLKR